MQEKIKFWWICWGTDVRTSLFSCKEARAKRGALWSYKKSEQAFYRLLRCWQREKDSNPHIRSQSPLCYLYTIPLCSSRTDIIIAAHWKMSRGNSKKTEKFRRGIPRGGGRGPTGGHLSVWGKKNPDFFGKIGENRHCIGRKAVIH